MKPVNFSNKRTGIILIIIGLLLVFIPLYRWSLSYYNQRMALAALDEPIEPAEPELPETPEPPVGTDEQVPEEPVKEDLPNYNGLLEIPEIDLEAAVIHGITEDDLKKGPGFYPQSTHPETGNVSIAAHRGVYGSWFRNIDKLEPGDEIFLTLGGTRYLYQVREQFITHSRDWSVVESDGTAELTLTTCLWTTTTKRLIVKADLTEVDTVP